MDLFDDIASTDTALKDLFVPLRTKWFRAFESGEKRHEWRPYGARWNAQTLPVGRGVILAHGYNGAGRLRRVIKRVDRVPAHKAPQAAREIYPHVEMFVRIELVGEDDV